MPPNSLFGSMPINGMAVVLALRQEWPGLVVSETHPKVLYYALSGRTYEWSRGRTRMEQMLSERMGCDLPELESDHEWDALISAFAVWQGVSGEWSTDLLELPTGSGERLLYPAGKTQYFWPNG